MSPVPVEEDPAAARVPPYAIDAEARDALADDREQAASLEAFLHDEDFSPGFAARRAAGIDRSDAKADRTSAAEDRSTLTDGGRARSTDDHRSDTADRDRQRP